MLLYEDGLESIEKVLHEEACWLLEQVGVACTDQRIIDSFESTYLAGYDFTTKRIYILKDLIKVSLESVPKKDKFPVPNYSFGGGGTAAYILQGDDYITPVAEIHLAEIMKTAEEFKIPFMFKGAGDAYTEEEEAKQIEISRKYYSGYLYVRAETNIGLEKCVEDYREMGKLCTTHSILDSPLRFNESGNNIDIFYNAAAENVPLYIVTMPISCLTGPASLYGLALLAYSEFLAGLVLSQIIQPGITVINGAFPAGCKPSENYRLSLGSVFHNMANYLVARTSDIYGVPSNQGGCTIDSFHNPVDGGTDPEAEEAYKFWNSLDRWHQVRHCFGLVDNLMAYDMNKMRRDLKVLYRILEQAEKIDVDFTDMCYDPEAYYAIKEGVSKGGFKTIYHTTKMMGVYS